MRCHDSYTIFDKAMADVLKLMEDNFANEFRQTEAFKSLERVVSKAVSYTHLTLPTILLV